MMIFEDNVVFRKKELFLLKSRHTYRWRHLCTLLSKETECIGLPEQVSRRISFTECLRVTSTSLPS